MTRSHPDQGAAELASLKLGGAQAQLLVERSAGDRLNLGRMGRWLFSTTHLGWKLMKLMSGPGAHTSTQPLPGKPPTKVDEFSDRGDSLVN